MVRAYDKDKCKFLTYFTVVPSEASCTGTLVSISCIRTYGVILTGVGGTTIIFCNMECSLILLCYKKIIMLQDVGNGNEMNGI